MRHGLLATVDLSRVVTTGANALCSAESLSRSHCFERHEELLVLRGWKSLQLSAGDRQCISILRRLDSCGPRRLTRTEFDLASAVAAGFAVKQVAAELDLEWATARTTISRALRKLGLRRCAQVPAFWHGLSGAASSSRVADGEELLVFESRLDAHGLAVRLTLAEREVLQAVLAGHGNQQIARQRNTSVRTVANQLATLFQKFGASSKGDLASKALLLDSFR
jgi:DNA-binding NarL/FixJ family response regulator